MTMYTLFSSETILTDDLREEFKNMVQDEFNARGPDAAVEHLYNDEPEQLKFHFSFSPKTNS